MTKPNNTLTAPGYKLQFLLLCVFVVLKLTNNITWGWVWVLSPLWIYLGTIAVFLFIFFLAWLVQGRPKVTWRYKGKKIGS